MMRTAAHHRQWDQITEALDKYTDFQIGILIRKAIEEGRTSGWPGLDYSDRAGLRKFLIGALIND